MLLESQNVGIILTNVLVWARELSIIGVLVGFSWKARGMWDAGERFVNRIIEHMDKMELFATTVQNNHLQHMEDSLNLLAYHIVPKPENGQDGN